MGSIYVVMTPSSETEFLKNVWRELASQFPY